MTQLNNLQRIIAEDFGKDDQDLISKLASILNPFMQQIIESYTNNLNFDNLNQQKEKFKIIVDANGNPINAGAASVKKAIKLQLDRRVAGVYCINAENQDTTTNYPSASPFIKFIQSSGLLNVNNVQGLTASEEYELTIIIFYER